ncbi:hypothetical protein L0P88_10425 [Muricauda sp. SCSIO 64092]|uniref:hypothetical protein n=1 Tax=Allomuricauda sp. SCSIO 64092 TaxID=2908842 RepID=UPI001FF5155B|nr:hypothetical protein [Muricauda sp. SCSIO 64092]UOY08928.1 hypothetical protein L0P88_10425 [Muricauda sp. SCSIO 64092]
MSFKVQIKNELHKKFWNILLVDSVNEWWEDEHWQIQWKHSQGLKIYIQFLIDPLDDSEKLIWEIRASKKLIPNRLLSENDVEIVSICMGKRKYSIKLKEFISEIEKFRINYEKKNSK